ncbi:MAG: prepilin-type N-terminal cleavage/methylation domain-containing protein [Nitrospirae bacterium]|nr:prepilin-type N-terminal cleavage/methylation domain-containing protein [Nitrospirota bacterium]
MNNKGFTMIEMMIVVAIIGVLAALSAPSYNRFIAHQRLNGATREIYSVMKGIRVSAIKEGTQYAIFPNTSTQLEVIVPPTNYIAFSDAVNAGINPPFTVQSTYDLSTLGYTGVSVTATSIVPIFQRTGFVSTVDTSGSTPLFSHTTTPGNFVFTSSYGETKQISINMAGHALIQ